MKDMLHLSYGFEVRALADEKRSVDVIASSNALDAFGEIVVQDWNLTRFAANPVVFFGHDSRGLPIGHASDVRVEDGKLLATLNLVNEKANPLAEQVWQGIKQGSLRAVSVGFRAGAATPVDIGGKSVIHLTNNELLEISVVGIPANPEAVALATKSLQTIRAMAQPTDTTETDTMSLKELITVLSLADNCSDAGVIAAVHNLQDFTGDVMTLTGAKSMPEAVGILRGWQASHEKVAEVTAKLVEVQKAAEDADRAALIKQARDDGKLAPASVEWAKSCPLESLKSFIATAPAIPQFKSDPKEPSHQSTTLEYLGKNYGALTPMEKHSLHQENPDLFVAMRDAWKRDHE